MPDLDTGLHPAQSRVRNVLVYRRIDFNYIAFFADVSRGDYELMAVYFPILP